MLFVFSRKGVDLWKFLPSPAITEGKIKGWNEAEELSNHWWCFNSASGPCRDRQKLGMKEHSIPAEGKGKGQPSRQQGEWMSAVAGDASPWLPRTNRELREKQGLPFPDLKWSLWHWMFSPLTSEVLGFCLPLNSWGKRDYNQLCGASTLQDFTLRRRLSKGIIKTAPPTLKFNFF